MDQRKKPYQGEILHIHDPLYYLRLNEIHNQSIGDQYFLEVRHILGGWGTKAASE